MSEPPPPGPYGPYGPYGSYPMDPQPGGYPPPPPGWGPAAPVPAPQPDGEPRDARTRQRPIPRVGVTIAGAGTTLVFLGALVWSIGYYAAGLHVSFDQDRLGASDGGGSRRFLGAAIFAVVLVAGYLLAMTRRRGALATAGAVGAAFGWPLVLSFLTLDVSNVFRADFPFNLDLVFLLSIAAWLVNYFAVPGLRGRALFLGAAALGLADYVAFKTVDVGTAASSGLSFSRVPDTGSLTAVALAFGLVYYAIAAVLDARGRSGAAVGLLVAAFFTTVSGVASGSRDMGEGGTGALLIVLGLGLSIYGARYGHRFTAWAWAAALVLGCLIVVDKVVDNSSYTGIGISLIVVGAVVVGLAYALGRALNETSEVVEGALQPAG